NTSALSLGRAYSRNELAREVGVAPPTSTREWTGIVGFRTSVFLFVTLDKEGRAAAHRYWDEFDGPLFYWDSQASNTAQTPKIQRLTDPREEVHLFARIKEKARGKTQPFFYCGRLTFQDSYGSQPVRFHWLLKDYPQGLNGPGLDALASWR